MATNKQQSANQCNAQHSTGQRTPDGKRISSINALRHGLTYHCEFNSLNPKLALLSQIIAVEIQNEDVSKIIASRILDYERTESYQQGLSAKELAGEDGYIDPLALQKVRNDAIAHAIFQGIIEKKISTPGKSKQEKKELKMYRDGFKALIQIGGSKERMIFAKAHKEGIRQRRYYKRASNQLIKAIKASSF